MRRQEEDKNPLNLRRQDFQETVFVPIVLSSEEINILPDKGKQPTSVLNYIFCKELAFVYAYLQEEDLVI